MPLYSISESCLSRWVPVSSCKNNGHHRSANFLSLSRSGSPSHPLRLATSPPEVPEISPPEIRWSLLETAPDEIPGIQTQPETVRNPIPPTPIPGHGPESPIPSIPSPPDVVPPETPEIVPPRPPPPGIFPPPKTPPEILPPPCTPPPEIDPPPITPPEIDPPPTTPPDIYPPGTPEIVPALGPLMRWFA
ncbi:protein TRACHEARY ELEMENT DIFFERENTIATION-RELATED 7A-like [Aristolochia californica]|uniref:protein TRACHEARY ELEMENT DIFFERENTIATION-RELATED 7A-like n=1 Tax=Aristolochia californica TaxID=171875 RepID=UPI0035DC9002